MEFTDEPSNVVVSCGTNVTAQFPCRYEGSEHLPDWKIDSITHSVYKLPHNHAYIGRVLSVVNISYRQNNTQYQCVVGIREDCNYYSSIGILIVKCAGKFLVFDMTVQSLYTLDPAGYVEQMVKSR